MAVALFTATTMFAQPEAGTVTIAPKAGISIATLSTDGTESKVGFVGGVEAGYQLNDAMALTLGVNYAQYGAKTEYMGQDVKMNMDYIAVPILYNYYLPVKGLAVKAGIEPAFKASAKLKANGASVDMGDGVNSVIMSIPVGVSYEMCNFILDARYNIGVTDAIEGGSSKQSAFVITLGYKFAL